MENNNNSNKDPKLWTIAKKRAGFKSHLYSYIIVNSFLWILWLITTPAEQRTDGNIPWPLWPLLGWGVGLALHYVFTYIIKYDGKDEVEKEYKKLVKEKQ